MNYEEQVKKVYPKAYSRMPAFFDIMVITDPETKKELGTGYFANEAWQSAYEKLLKDGKI